MRRAPRRATLRALVIAACLAPAATGCAARLFHRGPGTAAVPAAAETHAKKSRRPHDEHAAAPTLPLDPLGEARARAEQSPQDPYWPTRVAELEAAAGHAAEAESGLHAALARDSAYAPALAQLSRLLYRQGRHDEAVRLLAPVRERRVSLDADDRSALLAGLALHEDALGHPDEARAALALVPHGAREDAAGVAAYLAVRGGSPDSAAKLTEAAVKAAPESAANHNNRGIALLRAADPDGAAREFERAIALDPSLPGPWYNMAILERWYRLDRAAAIKRFHEYWSRSQADPDSLYPELGRAPSPPVAEGSRDK